MARHTWFSQDIAQVPKYDCGVVYSVYIYAISSSHLYSVRFRYLDDEWSHRLNVPSRTSRLP